MYDHALPDGLSLADFHRHPVRQLIRETAYHGRRALPSRADLDALGLPADVRRRVLDDCREVAALHSEGLQQDAWRLGDRHAAAVIDELDDELRDPDYWRGPDPLAGVNDPAKLAALVRPT